MLKRSLMVAAIVFMFAFTVSPAFASLDANVVYNENMAAVQNEVGAQANTGGNWAGGSYGGDGGDGGNINNSGGEEEGDVRDSRTGNGGNGGTSSTGGTVITGEAIAEASVRNRINWNETDLEACPCEEGEYIPAPDQVETLNILPPGHPPVPIRANLVINRNSAEVANRVLAQANTGDNNAEGSEAGEGGNGGTINNSGDDVDTSITGMGGTGGNSGEGGLVQTGRSVSRSDAVNVLNTNVTRIHRGEEPAE